MCGFAGFLGNYAAGHQHLPQMTDALLHRGPDDAGTWCDADAELGLGFRRLSILDLSPAGHQPMQSASGRYVVVFNGEIYNHAALRQSLERAREAPAWRGHSDTETLLAGFEAWGVDATVRSAVGMFAFALWDRAERVLTLGRDRIGEKPLYYGWQGGTFLFASELKALKPHPAFAATVDPDALTLLLRHKYIPAPHCIYRGMRKLLPGSLLSVSLHSRAGEPRRYWDFRAVVRDGLAQPFTGSADEAVSEFERRLYDAVRAQIVADVPVGAFLSGGIDSSAVVAVMQDVSDHPARTFSIGFAEAGYDEAGYARAVAQQLGTDHTELYVSPTEARDVIPLLPAMYCEPFADPSQIPTFLVSRLARQQVTVSLSGDGGDELLGGYLRYDITERFWRHLARVPVQARALVGSAMQRVSPAAWSRMLKPVHAMTGGSLLAVRAGQRVTRAAAALSARDATHLYRMLASDWTTPASVVVHAREPETLFTQPALRPRTRNLRHDMMALDTLSYLPDDILVKVDRAAMATSLETRVPFLDHRLVEFVWTLPASYKTRDGLSKWPLRQMLYRRLPRALIDRPKMGFGVPIDSWLRGPLREWADDLLGETRLAREGYFHTAPIRTAWQQHLSGQRDNHYLLWDVLMFQAWLAQN